MSDFWGHYGPLVAMFLAVLWLVELFLRLRGEAHLEQCEKMCDERLAAMRRALDAAGDASAELRKRADQVPGLRDALANAIEDVGAQAVRIEAFVQERQDLLACGMALQQLVADLQVRVSRQREAIEALNPYQAIPSILPWGKN